MAFATFKGHPIPHHAAVFMNFRRFFGASLVLVLPFSFLGCATTSPRQAYGEVDHLVSERLGQSVALPQGADAKAPATAPSARPLTAETAVRTALLNNRRLRAELEEVGISQADFAQASRLPNPRIAGSWRVPDRPPSAVDAEYSLVGNLLDLLTLSARKTLAGHDLEAAKLHAADEVLRLASQTRTVFYRLEAQLQLVRDLGVIVRAGDAAADFARRQHEAGNITGLDLREQEASAAQGHLDLIEARERAAELREDLDRLMGLSGDDGGWAVADHLPPLPAADPDLGGLETIALRRRLDLATARARLAALTEALRMKQRTRFIPGVSAGVDTERTPDGQRVTGPTLDLELPLFDQGQPALAKLAAEVRQAGDRCEALETAIRSEVRKARDALVASREAAELSGGRLLPLRSAILQDTLLQYNAMQKSTRDLLLAKQSEEATLEQNVVLLRRYWLARVALEQAVGGRLPAAVPSSSNPTRVRSGA